MQMNCSMVITDPKGTLIEECGKMLAKGPPKKDKNGNIMKDKSGKVVHEPYVIKVLNTINFSKSLHYNPFAYIRSEKDILKLVTRDEYGTLSINVEEEVNIPSGVTIGNVMLPSVKETFEQIWPDAVKKALEILFKQNRTEKMSMAQYQIYVSKLWSEICQKVGYMNIVDYDNFGDIKSIFYDLEKRHLIKKENDGIE